MDVVEVVRAKGGIVPSARLTEAGVKGHAIQRAVSAGALVRVRRRWVAAPDADVDLVGAARTGTVLSCVTQARRIGLWVLDSGSGVHVAARPHAGRIAPNDLLTVHWRHPVVPRHPDALEDSIENVLALVSICQPRESALAVWESALQKGLIDRQAVERLPLPAAARALLGEASPFSGSGLESFVVPRLRWLRLRIIPQAWIRDHRVDFLIGDRIVFQIDGGTHVGAQRTEDIAHDAQLMLLGYHVIRVGYDQVVNEWPSVQDVIMRAVAQGLHRAK